MKRRLQLLMTKLFKHAMTTPLTAEERYAIIIAGKMLADKDNELMMHTNRLQFYINTPEEDLLFTLTIDPACASICNQNEGHDIKLSQRALARLYKMFVAENDSRREVVEQQYADKRRKSLIAIAHHLKKTDNNE